MDIKGVMIDCSRCIEQHRYYFELIEFMSDWGLNTLVLHFADDEGLAVQLRGFEDIAKPHSFTIDEIHKLIEYADKRGIDVIPEVEMFGHTRYLTDLPQYSHLAGKDADNTKPFNAINPLHPETLELMRRLILSVVEVFPSQYLHIGCDEVNLDSVCGKRGLDPSVVWVEYVNKLISMVKESGKVPMLWADHIEKDDKIREKLDKEVVLIYWNYAPNVSDDGIVKLKESGFKGIVTGSSIACYLARFLPGYITLENVKRLTQYTIEHNLLGSIVTIWCPYRYFQKTMYYGMGYFAELVQNEGKLDMERFHRRFVGDMFSAEFNSSVGRFLANWPMLHLPVEFFWKYIPERNKLSEEVVKEIYRVNALGREILPLGRRFVPNKNVDVWEEMILAGEAFWLCSEGYIVNEEDVSDERRKSFEEEIKKVYKLACEVWDKDRFSDDPIKYAPYEEGEENAYALLILKRFIPDRG